VIKIESLANKIANKIAIQLNFDDEKRAVIAYGLIGILQLLTLFTIITILGLIFDYCYESIIIFFCVSVIRKSSGGAHAKTMMSCNIMSIFTVIFLSVLSRYILDIPLNLYANLGLSVVVYAICFIIFYYRVPIDSPNKPIIKPEKIKKLRRQCFLILTMFIVLSVIFIILTTYNKRFYSIAISIRLAMLWQLLTLTKIGGLFIEKMDSMIYQVISKK